MLMFSQICCSACTKYLSIIVCGGRTLAGGARVRLAQRKREGWRYYDRHRKSQLAKEIEHEKPSTGPPMKFRTDRPCRAGRKSTLRRLRHVLIALVAKRRLRNTPVRPPVRLQRGLRESCADFPAGEGASGPRTFQCTAWNADSAGERGSCAPDESGHGVTTSKSRLV